MKVIENNQHCSKKLNKLSSDTGASLVEIVIAVAILGILAVSFISVFTSSYTSVFSTGNRNKAMSNASSVLERLYAMKRADIDALTPGSTVVNAKMVDTSGLYQYPGVGDIRFSRAASTISAGSDGYLVTVVVFYEKGKKYAELKAFVKGG